MLLRKSHGSRAATPARAGYSAGTTGALDAPVPVYVLVGSGPGSPTSFRASPSPPHEPMTAAPDRPTRYGEGWTLLVLHRDRWNSTPLAARGAAPAATPRVAKAVALRVLRDSGVAVSAWRGGGGGDRPMFRALLGDG